MSIELLLENPKVIEITKEIIPTVSVNEENKLVLRDLWNAIFSELNGGDGSYNFISDNSELFGLEDGEDVYENIIKLSNYFYERWIGNEESGLKLVHESSSYDDGSESFTRVVQVGDVCYRFRYTHTSHYGYHDDYYNMINNCKIVKPRVVETVIYE